MYPYIRRATPADVPAMYMVSLRAHQRSYINLIPQDHRARFDKKYSFSKLAEASYSKRMLSRLNDPAWYIWIAEFEGQVVGYTKEQRVSPDFIQKRGLFVDPDYHGRGIGTMLFETSMSIADTNTTLRLSVIENNERAKRLYLAHGFRPIGYEEKTYFGARLEIMEHVPVASVK